jgi:hypothetical protein
MMELCLHLLTCLQGIGFNELNTRTTSLLPPEYGAGIVIATQQTATFSGIVCS